MNCNTCKHYDKSDYPFHCELADKDERFCHDCMHGIFHYTPKDEYVETEIDCEEIILHEYEQYEHVDDRLKKPHIDWKTTILHWLLLLCSISILIGDTYLIIMPIINHTFNIITAILLVSSIFLFYIIIKYFWQLAMPKRKY